jgi:hypothetical protein
MSKGHKKKVTVKTIPGQAVFVASVEVLTHIAQTYQYMASTSNSEEEINSWKQVSADIIQWISKTHHKEGEKFDEEW